MLCQLSYTPALWIIRPVPAGPGGLAPQLTLQYNTGLANSPSYGATDGTRSRRSDFSLAGPDWVFDLGHVSLEDSDPG